MGQTPPLQDSDGPRAAAYGLALRYRSHLQERYLLLETKLEQIGKRGLIRGLVEFIRAGRPAINMSTPACIRFLETGFWLNVYEAAAQSAGSDPARIEDEIRRRLGRWHAARILIDRLLQFGPSTHYAALNVGGPGPVRYGDCCVVFRDIATDVPSTCFAGDSIRTITNAQAEQVLSDEAVFARFATGQDLPMLASTHCATVLEGPIPILDGARLRRHIEQSDNLIEIHVHGPLSVLDIERVVFGRLYFEHMWELVAEFDATKNPTSMRFDPVGPFKELMRLLLDREIPRHYAEEN